LTERQASRFVDDGRLYAPAALRNRAALIALLREVLPESGTVLEIASGTGEHAVAFAEAFPQLLFHPSEPNATCRASIAAWINATGVGNVLAPLALDARELIWLTEPVDAVLCINLLHLAAAPVAAVMRGVAVTLKQGGVFVTYGPFTPELTATITKAAEENGLTPLPAVAMPDQHQALVFHRAP
jgi:tRNA A58 N-methylase Trm61